MWFDEIRDTHFRNDELVLDGADTLADPPIKNIAAAQQGAGAGVPSGHLPDGAEVLPSGGKVVFVIDDDLSMLKSIASLLSNLGYVTEQYSSAEAFLSTSTFCSIPNSCIVLDIQLGGMSGIELGSRLASAGQAPPIIFITGTDSESARKAAVQQGCDAYLTKPCPPRLLVDAIERALA